MEDAESNVQESSWPGRELRPNEPRGVTGLIQVEVAAKIRKPIVLYSDILDYIRVNAQPDTIIIVVKGAPHPLRTRLAQYVKVNPCRNQ